MGNPDVPVCVSYDEWAISSWSLGGYKERIVVIPIFGNFRGGAQCGRTGALQPSADALSGVLAGVSGVAHPVRVAWF